MPMLSDERRRKIKRKAQAQTNRQLRKPTRRANRQTSRIAAGTDRRAAGVRRSYARQGEQIGNISLAGLKGRYRDEAAHELAASQAGLRRVMPHHVNKVEARGASRIRGINSQLRDAREETFQSNFHSLLDAARSRVGAREEEAADLQEDRVENRDERAEELKTAMQQAKFMLSFGVDPDAEGVSEAAKAAGHPVTPEDWMMFRQMLQGKEGVGFVAARRAVEELQRRMDVAQTARNVGAAGARFANIAAGQ